MNVASAAPPSAAVLPGPPAPQAGATDDRQEAAMSAAEAALPHRRIAARDLLTPDQLATLRRRVPWKGPR